MYNRYVSSEHSYEPSEISEPSTAESEPYISKEKYIRENDTVQEGNAHSSAFFRNFGNIQAEKSRVSKATRGTTQREPFA